MKLILRASAILFALLFILGATACGNKVETSEKSNSETSKNAKTSEEQNKEMLCNAANGPSRAAMNCPPQ